MADGKRLIWAELKQHSSCELSKLCPEFKRQGNGNSKKHTSLQIISVGFAKFHKQLF